MKKYLFLALFLVGLNQSASAYFVVMNDYWIDSTQTDDSLSETEAIFSVRISNVLNAIDQTIRYSDNGIESTSKCDNNGVIHIMTSPGRHVFQFYVNKGYREVYTDSLSISGNQRVYMTVHFPAAFMQVVPAKPVIYLFPEEETEVTVDIDIKGSDPFYYPNYNGLWSFTANPNGNLIFGDKTYNYLFWESTQRIRASKIEQSEGFIVSGNEVVEFLEKTLDLAGLSSEIQADFITYWGPQLAQNELNRVHFMFNEECDEFAELTINPRPESIYRIYILWKPIDKRIELKNQVITPLVRDGFTVIEWGGMVLPESVIN